MTPDTIRQAIYQIGQAAETKREVAFGGIDLGRMFTAHFRAWSEARRQLGSASCALIESMLERFATSGILHQAKIAGAALDLLHYVEG